MSGSPSPSSGFLICLCCHAQRHTQERRSHPGLSDTDVCQRCLSAPEDIVQDPEPESHPSTKAEDIFDEISNLANWEYRIVREYGS